MLHILALISKKKKKKDKRQTKLQDNEEAKFKHVHRNNLPK